MNDSATPGPSPRGYRLLGLLRRGEDVDVLDAWSEERDCRCVLKLLRSDRRTDRGARSRLLDEGRMLLGLAHPHLVRAYEVHTHPPAVVLETLGGETLGHMIGAGGPRLPAADVAALGAQLASALGYLHRNGVLHLDVKPSNVVCQEGQAKLIDLGIAQAPGRCRRGVGTPESMAPEQQCGGVASAATDAWGLGATLFAAAAGTAPFGADGWAGVRAPPVRRLRRLPTAVAQIIDACLDPDPAARPAIARIGAVLRPLAV